MAFSFSADRTNVLPIIDLQTGQVQFRIGDQWLTFYVCDPQQLSRALATSARRASFEERAQTLLIFVASQGVPEGSARAFSLAKFPSETSFTKLGN